MGTHVGREVGKKGYKILGFLLDHVENRMLKIHAIFWKNIKQAIQYICITFEAYPGMLSTMYIELPLLFGKISLVCN